MGMKNPPIDRKLYDMLHTMVALYAIENQLDLFELKATIDLFYERYLGALKRDEKKEKVSEV